MGWGGQDREGKQPSGLGRRRAAGSDSPYLAALAATAGDTPGEMGHTRAQDKGFPPSHVPLLSRVPCYHQPTDLSFHRPSTPPSSIFPKVFIKLLVCVQSRGAHRKRLQVGLCKEIQLCPKKE